MARKWPSTLTKRDTARVTGDDQAAALGVEAIAEGRLDGVVLDEERRHAQAVALEDAALLDLGHLHAGRLALVHVRAPDLDVPLEVVQQLVDLAAGAGRAVHGQRRVLPHDPARDQEM